jgi:hypothetical protein
MTRHHATLGMTSAALQRESTLNIWIAKLISCNLQLKHLLLMTLAIQSLKMSMAKAPAAPETTPVDPHIGVTAANE